MFDFGPEEPARSAPAIVAIGGSAGALSATRDLLAHLPEHLPAAVVVALHLPPSRMCVSRLPDILQLASPLPVQWAERGGRLRAGRVHVAPQDTQTALWPSGHFRMYDGPSRWQPNIDALFSSAAETAGSDTIGIVLSGLLHDGARGANAIQQAGGLVLVQDRPSCYRPDMPRATLQAGASALVLPPSKLAAAVTAFLLQPGARRWFGVERDSAYLRTGFV